MSLNDTPSAERITIGFFGCRNAGKSSLVNAITNQELSVVSDVKGTTTDPVRKAMELLPIGPVVIIDTPGFDDEGALGQLRVEKTRDILAQVHMAVLVVDAKLGLNDYDRQLKQLFLEKEVPYVVAYNKLDQVQPNVPFAPEEEILSYTVSAKTKAGVSELLQAIAKAVLKDTKQKTLEPPLISDLIKPMDVVVLVMPIDESAPKGRLILPQQQMIRAILEVGAIPVCADCGSLPEALARLNTPPALVITDSQVFAQVQKIVPEDVPLTSFSILMARYKGFLELAVEGVSTINQLKDGAKILISEGCTHHRQCEDIGTVKLPALLKKYTGVNFTIDVTSGHDFAKDVRAYDLVIHCGGCMLNGKEMKNRMEQVKEAGVPVTNYGIAIAHMTGILERSIFFIKH